MARAFRRILLALVAATVFAPGAWAYAPAPQRPALPLAVGTANVLVHYTADPDVEGHITQTAAADLASRVEKAYSTITSWGFGAPVADGGLGGDNRVDIYVVDMTDHGKFAFLTYYDGAYGNSSASIDVDAGSGTDQFEVAAAFWSVISAGMWAGADSWLVESTSAWAGFKVMGYPDAAPNLIGPWQESLDCEEFPTAIGSWTQNCDSNLYNGSGESRWPLWQYLTEKYGTSFVNAVYANGAGGVSAVQAVDDAIVARGGTFAGVFSSWAAANMSGGYTAGGLQALIPKPSATINAGTIAGTSSVNVSVNHLATRFVAITRGDLANNGPCYGATLTVSVALPAGSSAVPYFWWPPDGLGKAQALAVNGSTATLTVPWDTCYWSKWNAGVSLPNPSATADSQIYTVTTTMTVDKSVILTATSPPGMVTMPGTVVFVPTVDMPPSIDVAGPELIRVSSSDRILRLIVTSDGAGTLSGALGGLSLGSADLRAGHNDVRFDLPATALAKLRRTAAADSSTLTLTPLSPLGSPGPAIVRQVEVAPTQAKAKPKAKPKAKKKPAAKPKKHAAKR